MVQQKHSCRERSRDFLVKAREELAAGDLEQAAEKGWGGGCHNHEGICGPGG